MATPTYHRGLHMIAWATACATFPLIFMGGLVTSHGAGLAVPDWPNSYGYNMFLFPPRLWVGNIFYEHVHRLMGAVVGMLAIALTVVAWRSGVRPAIRWLATAVLGAVIVQGAIGGLRVIQVNVDLAFVHGCTAPLVFCLVSLVVMATSRGWTQAKGLVRDAGGPGLMRLGMLSVGVVYLQMVMGAVMRHFHAGLAIPDFPLSFGHVLPPFSTAALAALWKSNDPMPSLAGVWIHFAHRLMAVVVSVLVIALIARVLRQHREQGLLRGPAYALMFLLPAQIALGIVTVLCGKPADIASAHVAVGALTLATTFVLTAGAVRIYGRRRVADERVVGRFTAVGMA